MAIPLVVTPGIGGHAGSGDLVPLAVPADALHLAAVAVWLGGLVMLFAALLPVADASELRTAVPRYSQLALVSVLAIMGTGAFQAWRQVGSISALRDTDFGRLLVIKVLIFGALVVAAAFSREIVNRSFRARTVAARARDLERVGAGPGTPPSGFDDEPLDDATEVRSLRRSVLIEVGLAMAILAVTALLVNAPPGRAASNQPITEVFDADELSVEVRVDPAPRRAEHAPHHRADPVGSAGRPPRDGGHADPVRPRHSPRSRCRSSVSGPGTGSPTTSTSPFAATGRSSPTRSSTTRLKWS